MSRRWRSVATIGLELLAVDETNVLRRKPSRLRTTRSAHAGEPTTMPARDRGAADISPDEIERIFRAAKAQIRRRA